MSANDKKICDIKRKKKLVNVNANDWRLPNKKLMKERKLS